MIDHEAVARLRKTRDWAHIQSHIQGVVASLDRLPATAGKDDRTIAIEAIGREWALTKLKEVLAPFIEHRERPNIEDRQRERAEDAGL